MIRVAPQGHSKDAPTRRGWVVKISPEVDLKPIRPAHFKMAAILERMLRANPEAWPTNATLAARYGCTRSQVQKILRGMEKEGFISRVLIDPEDPRAGRSGILANRRLDLDKPVANRPPSPEDVGRLKARRGGIKNDAGGASKMMPPGGIKNDAPSNKESLSLKEDGAEGPGWSLDQRQRKDTPTLTASPVAPTPQIPAAAPALAAGPERPPLTPGQEAFLASLDDVERAAFEAWPAARRAAALAAHAIGFDRVIAGEVYRQLGPPPPPPSPLPPTEEELLEQLPGKPRAWAMQTAELLVKRFGSKKDRALWGEFNRIAESVRVGGLAAEHVINAYRQAMAPGIKNRGAKFWAALKALAELEPSDLAELSAPC
jgi:hypothetical protein